MFNINVHAHAEQVLVREQSLFVLLALHHFLSQFLGHPEAALRSLQFVHHQTQLGHFPLAVQQFGFEDLPDITREPVFVLLVLGHQLRGLR